ncbi:MAG TPA: cytochrome c3 family protein [Xanthobacteraceae bacterium]|nr:cytochrome c3 family protein [Xanthobacteraceae bacterium]
MTARIRSQPGPARVALSLALAALVFAVAAPAQNAGRAKLSSAAKATDCKACHAGKTPLPQQHPNIAGKSLGDCAACHAPGTDRALRGRMPLFHAHLLAGLTCASCHADAKKPKLVEADRCMGCHDPEKVAAKTAAMKPTNPHNSRHYGVKADCNLCHHQHEKSENYCAQCHNNFDFKVP